MAISNLWTKIYGIVNGALRIGLSGPTIAKDDTSDNKLNVRAQDGTSHASLDVHTASVSALDVTATGGRRTTITMAPGSASDLSFVLPNNDGNSGDVLTTDGDGHLSWTAPGGAESLATRMYSLAFNSGSTIDLVNMPANTFVREIIIIVSTAFNGSGPAPSMTIGTDAEYDRFVSVADVRITRLGTYVIDVAQLVPSASQMKLFYAAAGSGGTAGEAKIIVVTSVPIE